MKYTSFLLFFFCIITQTTSVSSTAEDFSTKEEINKRLRQNEPINYPSFCENLKNAYGSSEEALEALKKFEREIPQTKLKSQESLMLTLCFDDIPVNERLFRDENKEIIKKLGLQKPETAQLEKNFNTQRELAKQRKHEAIEGASIDAQIQHEQVDLAYLNETQMINQYYIDVSYEFDLDQNAKYARQTKAYELEKQVKEIEKEKNAIEARITKLENKGFKHKTLNPVSAVAKALITAGVLFGIGFRIPMLFAKSGIFLFRIIKNKIKKRTS